MSNIISTTRCAIPHPARILSHTHTQPHPKDCTTLLYSCQCIFLALLGSDMAMNQFRPSQSVSVVSHVYKIVYGLFSILKRVETTEKLKN